MNLKKIGIVLFLLIAVAGFSLSSISASGVYDDQVTVGTGKTTSYFLPSDFGFVKVTPIGDAADYATVKDATIFLNNGVVEITGLKETTNGKTADFIINSKRSNNLHITLHVTVKKTIW
jgi:hypothetical protein